MRVVILTRQDYHSTENGGIMISTMHRVVGVYGNQTLAENAMFEMYPDARYDEYGSYRYEHHYYTDPDRFGNGELLAISTQEIIET